MNKNLKIAIISSKGGVGKSTISIQLMNPYLYEKNNNQVISHYEFDDENSDSLSFGASCLSKREQINVASPLLREDLATIFSKDETMCLDVGGNKTTMTVIEALNESGMINFLDLVVIPILDGEQDGINASYTYSVLKGYNKDLKFLFVLNRAKDLNYIEYQFENYFGDVRGIFKDTYSIVKNLFEEDKNNYIAMLDDDIIKYSRRFGLSIYEIAKLKKDFISELEGLITEHSAQQEVKLVSFKNYIANSAKKYEQDVLQPAFSKINTILYGEGHA